MSWEGVRVHEHFLEPITIATSHNGYVTFVQRVNTVGGNAPSSPGANAGDTAEVPYSAEYYFYSAED